MPAICIYLFICKNFLFLELETECCLAVTARLVKHLGFSPIGVKNETAAGPRPRQRSQEGFTAVEVTSPQLKVEEHSIHCSVHRCVARYSLLLLPAQASLRYTQPPISATAA